MSSGSPILLKIVSENLFSGKTYSYTIASRTIDIAPIDNATVAEEDEGSVDASYSGKCHEQMSEFSGMQFSNE